MFCPLAAADQTLTQALQESREDLSTRTHGATEPAALRSATKAKGGACRAAPIFRAGREASIIAL